MWVNKVLINYYVIKTFFSVLSNIKLYNCDNFSRRKIIKSLLFYLLISFELDLDFQSFANDKKW